MKNQNRSLIEIYQLIKLRRFLGIPPGVVAGNFQENGTPILGSDDDIININGGPEGPPGPPGPEGPVGPPGPQGPPGTCECTCSAILVDSDYDATSSDFYIGVNSSGPVTITLPDCEEGCQEIIVKAEMPPPVGNRKVTILTSNGTDIDGKDKIVLQEPWESVRLLCRDGNWFVI